MNIQKLRLQRGWSQQQLAELSGLSSRTIQRIENGQPASAESLKSLASVFEIDFTTLTSEPDMSATATATATECAFVNGVGSHVMEMIGYRRDDASWNNELPANHVAHA